MISIGSIWQEFLEITVRAALILDVRGWSDLEDFLIDTNSSISYLVVAGLDRISRNFYKTDKEIKRLKEEYGITIVPVQKHLSLEDMLNKKIRKRRRKGI